MWNVGGTQSKVPGFSASPSYISLAKESLSQRPRIAGYLLQIMLVSSSFRSRSSSWKLGWIQCKFALFSYSVSDQFLFFLISFWRSGLTWEEFSICRTSFPPDFTFDFYSVSLDSTILIII